MLIGAGMWKEINSLKGYAKHDDPVFVSAKGGHLCRSMVFHIVKKAANNAGIEGNVSPHEAPLQNASFKSNLAHPAQCLIPATWL